MNYSFEFNSQAMSRIQSFEYSYITTNEYAFTYGRDIFSNLSKFNAPVFAMKKRRSIFSYEKIYSAKLFKKDFEEYNTLTQGYNADNQFDIYKNYLGNKSEQDIYIPENYSGSITEEDLYIQDKELTANKNALLSIFKEFISGQQSKSNFDINNNNYLGEKDISKKISISRLKTFNKKYSLEEYDNYFLRYTTDNLLHVYKDVVSAKQDINSLYVNDVVSAYKLFSDLFIYNNYMATDNIDNMLNIFKQYYLQKPNNNIYINNNFLISRIKHSRLFVNKVVTSDNIIRNVGLYKQVIIKDDKTPELNIYKYYMSKKQTGSLYINKNLSGKRVNYKMFYNDYILHGELNSSKLDVYKDYFGNKTQNMVNIKNNLYGAIKHKKALLTIKDMFVYKDKHNMVYNSYISIYKDKHEMSCQETVPVFKDRHELFYDDYSFAYKHKHELFYDNYKFIYKHKHETNYNNFIIINKNKHEMFYDSYFLHGNLNTNKLDIYKDYFCNKDDKGIFTIKDYFGKEIRKGFSILNKELTANKSILLNIFNENITAYYNKSSFNIYANKYFIKKDTLKIMPITELKTFNMESSLKIYDNYLLCNENKSTLKIYKNAIFINTKEKEISIYDTVLIHKLISQITVNNNITLNNKDNALSVYDNHCLNKIDNEVFTNKEYVSLQRNVNKIFVNKNTVMDYISNKSNNISLYKQESVKDCKAFTINIYDYYVMQNKTKKVHINNGLSLKAIDGEIFFQNGFSLFKDNRKMFYNNHDLYGDLDASQLNTYKGYFLNKREDKSIIQNILLQLTKDKEEILPINNDIFLYRYNHNVFSQKLISMFKDKNGFGINNTDLSIKLPKKGFEISNTVLIFGLLKKGFIINNIKTLKRKKSGFSINELEKYLYKKRNGINPDNYDYFLNNNKNGISIDNTIKAIEQIRKGFIVDNHTKNIYRDRCSMSINITEADISKIKIPIGISTDNNTIGIMLPNKKGYKQNDEQTLSLDPKEIFTKNTEIFLEKEKYRLNKNLNNIFLITEQRKTFLEYYHNIMLSKNIKHCLLNITNQSFEKKIKNSIIDSSIINISRKYKNAFIEYNISIFKGDEKLLKNNTDNFYKKSTKEGYFYSAEIYLKHTQRKSMYSNNIWISKELYTADKFKYTFMSDNIYEICIIDNNVCIDKAKYNATKNIYFSVDIKLKETYKTQDTLITKKEKNTDIDNYVFITKQQYDTNPYVSEMTHMQKVIKDLEKSIDKKYDWVYVHQYEDPIDPNYEYYGLDELLLPEKDVDYSSFENAIFNKETMTPKRPVKILDDNTFIAKYPIKHPTPNYEDVGIVYADVPSELMYAIFTKFYQIWYANIFKFGNMSMVDSLRLMLEYMYAHVVTTYSGTEYLEAALRVFRQIRWFGETSVMHNAQYKITCEFEDLKSNLQTGECMIKNELYGFSINKKLKVIVSDPTSIRQDAYIKLYTANKGDSRITFSVSLTGGILEVYINDELIDTIYSNHPSISYELPATDTENIIVLKRPERNNIGYCYVGNIIIKNGTYKNLNIEYDPELKAGNMPLNDIVNKMVILANMYDNEQEVFEQYRKGNLAVSELYKKLENYWELHHANKTKGKRLTIKEV